MRSCWSLKLSDVGLFLFLVSTSARAQFSEPESLPRTAAKSEYTFPIEPGKTAMLTGTMGELRNTHFHGGLDINTRSIGYPVYSANDGYISRATTSTSGYGNSLLVTHPDGNTTLYAHLNEFQGAVAEFMRQERYRKRTSELEMNFLPTQFPVKKGEVIALSGNTGSSGGPHLHFELRNEQNEAVNPLTVGFSEVVDHLPPVVQKIAMRTMTPNSRINDQFGRFEFYVGKSGKDYVLPQPILASGKIGLEVLAYDKQENSVFKFGINLIELYVNGQRVFVQTIDKIKFSENRNILVLMDYRTLELKGQRYNKLYVDQGNRLPYYTGTSSPSGIDVTSGTTPVQIRLIDYFGNTTNIDLSLQFSPPSAKAFYIDQPGRPIQAEVHENILKVTTQTCGKNDSTVTVFQGGAKKVIAANYQHASSRVFLIDIAKDIPDSVVACGGSWVSNWVDRVPSHTDYKYFSNQLEIEFPNQALYDTLLLRVASDSSKGREILTIGSTVVPLQTPIKVVYRPAGGYVPNRNTGVYRLEGAGYAYLGNNWRNGRFTFNTLSFGEFTVLSDSIPPTVKPISINNAVARLRIRDDLSGISYFEANINGQWLLMNYDYKTGVLYSERLDKAKPLKGDFELKVVDNAGNESIYKQKIP